jgi:hypothetical protein
MRKIVVIIVVMFFISCTSNKHTLRNAFVGYVFNENGKPIEGVEVKLDSNDILSPRNVKTNTKGLFFMEKIEKKNYDYFLDHEKISKIIILHKAGFVDDTINLENKTGTLNKEDTIKLGIIYLKKNFKN